MSEQHDEIRDLYRQLVLDHAREPRNFGRIENATHTAEGINPLCGDKLRLYLSVDANDQITSVGFEGSGCAISVASASLLTEVVADLSVADADECFTAVTGRLTQQTTDISAPKNVDLAKLKALDGVRQHPSRVKCATLAWHALHAALEHSSTTATTE
jgi:nitrogen fixation NifU-like protein